MSETASRRIRAQASAGDAEIMGFVLDEVIQSGSSVCFETAGDAPLPRALFALDGVTRIEVSGHTIWVKRQADADWSILKPAIAAAIRNVLEETDAPLGQDAEGIDPDQTLLNAVKDWRGDRSSDNEF